MININKYQQISTNINTYQQISTIDIVDSINHGCFNDDHHDHQSMDDETLTKSTMVFKTMWMTNMGMLTHLS